eukprot:1330588-Amorphochlora_amoeboformis.AAC.1
MDYLDGHLTIRLHNLSEIELEHKLRPEVDERRDAFALVVPPRTNLRRRYCCFSMAYKKL